jgi:hypothetical protein
VGATLATLGLVLLYLYSQPSAGLEKANFAVTASFAGDNAYQGSSDNVALNVQGYEIQTPDNRIGLVGGLLFVVGFLLIPQWSKSGRLWTTHLPAQPVSPPTMPPAMTSFCTQCGHGLKPGAGFCSKCGAKARVLPKEGR